METIEGLLKNEVTEFWSCLELEREEHFKPSIHSNYLTLKLVVKFDTCVSALVRPYNLYEGQPGSDDGVADQRMEIIIVQLMTMIENTDNSDYQLMTASLLGYSCDFNHDSYLDEIELSWVGVEVNYVEHEGWRVTCVTDCLHNKANIEE